MGVSRGEAAGFWWKRLSRLAAGFWWAGFRPRNQHRTAATEDPALSCGNSKEMAATHRHRPNSAATAAR